MQVNMSGTKAKMYHKCEGWVQTGIQLHDNSFKLKVDIGKLTTTYFPEY